MGKNINVKIIHPTNDSDVDIGAPDIILLRDVFSQLIDAGFLSPGQPYTGVLMPRGIRQDSMPLDNDKTIGENGVQDNDIIQTLIATQAGGFDLVELWREFYPYLDQVGTVIGIAGAAIGFGSWLKNRFGKEYSPRQFTQIITDKEFWNIHELAITLDISDEESKNLLKGFGYEWNKSFSLYHKTEKTVEIIEKLKNSNY